MWLHLPVLCGYDSDMEKVTTYKNVNIAKIAPYARQPFRELDITMNGTLIFRLAFNSIAKAHTFIDKAIAKDATIIDGNVSFPTMTQCENACEYI